MDLKKLSVPLRVDQIDFRVQSINKGGYATILAYKDARADMQRLDDVCGGLWMRSHSRENHNCTVSIWNEEIKQWVGREDTGTESNTEQQKGLASDSFKRACFNWGIGRELYDYPFIQVKLRANEFEVDGNGKAKATWNLKLKSWRWVSQWKEGVLIYLQAMDGEAERFTWGSPRTLTEWVDTLADSILAIKEGIASGELSSAAEAWFELEAEEKRGIWVAPSNGGPFTSEERKVIQSSEFRQSHYGEKA